jgi:hypothetical protein
VGPVTMTGALHLIAEHNTTDHLSPKVAAPAAG